jgi:acyl dehydratase
VLTLVLMNPRKGKGKSGQAASGEKDSKQAKRDETPPATMAAGQPLDTWKLPENTGRAYAALDGDISPMHLYKATAMLMGFPAPVANVHLLAARAEASIAANKGEGRQSGLVCCSSIACLLLPPLQIHWLRLVLLLRYARATRHPAGAAAAPLSLELEFKKPVLLPAKLSLLTTGGELSAQGGLALRVDDAKGRPLATGVVSSRSAITCF